MVNKTNARDLALVFDDQDSVGDQNIHESLSSWVRYDPVEGDATQSMVAVIPQSYLRRRK